MVYAETKNKQTRKWHHAGMSHQCLWGTQKSAGNRAGGSTNSRLCESVYIFREKKTRRVDVLMSSDSGCCTASGRMRHVSQISVVASELEGRGVASRGANHEAALKEEWGGEKKQVKRWRLSRDLTVFGEWDARDFNYSEVSFLWGWCSSQSSKESGTHPFHSCQSGEVSFVTRVSSRVAWALKYCCCDHSIPSYSHENTS